METGRLIVLTGPSGVGKGTLLRSLLQRHPELYFSISVTTRSPRPGEIDGKDYYFISRSDFEQMVKAEKFLEWAEYAGNYYGTPRLQVEVHIARVQSVLLDFELEGARQIGKTFPDALRIFILPPSLPELEQRIRRRGTDSEDAIARRLSRAGDELAAATEFDIQIINDDLEITIHRIEAALFTYNPPFPADEP